MYRIARFTFDMKHLAGSQSPGRLVPFFATDGAPEATYRFAYREALSLPSQAEFVYRGNLYTVLRDGEDWLFVHTADDVPYAITRERSSGQYDVMLLKDSLETELHPYVVPYLLMLERPLLRRDCLVLHSSCVATERGSILFTAPSGGGKTTQSEFWRDSCGAHIVNGDKNALGRKPGGGFVTYGLPFSGSSPDCLNENHPLRAVVLLGKGPRDELVRLNGRGFAQLFSQIVQHPWDADYMERALGLAQALCEEVPIYFYSCTKRPQAALTLRDALEREEERHGADQ